jgi:glutamate carboxypeptidase
MRSDNMTLLRIPARTVVLILVVLVPSSQLLGQQLSKQEVAVVHSIDEEAPTAVALLEKIVNMNSGTFNPAGVLTVGKVLEHEFQALGFTTLWGVHGRR